MRHRQGHWKIQGGRFGDAKATTTLITKQKAGKKQWVSSTKNTHHIPPKTTNTEVIGGAAVNGAANGAVGTRPGQARPPVPRLAGVRSLSQSPRWIHPASSVATSSTLISVLVSQPGSEPSSDRPGSFCAPRPRWRPPRRLYSGAYLADLHSDSSLSFPLSFFLCSIMTFIL